MDWQPAFEMAGFKNGIVAKDAPSKAEDPDWSIEDMRYSVIDYLPSTTENAVGPHIHDPRSGEILNADVQYYHNVMNLAKNWYFVQASPNDPRAQQLPLPEDLMGKLVRYVVAHEVGHTLGFQHNMKASSTYTIEQVRDPKWVKENGHTPTLMDYSRFNYVAQPEDKIDPIDLIPKIGPVRQVGDDVGLQADSRREDAGGGKAHPRQVGARAGHEALPAVLDRGQGRHGPGRQDGGRRRCRRRDGDDAGHPEPVEGVRDADEGHQLQGRRAVGRARRGLRPHGRTVDHRDGPRRADHRRHRLAAEAHRSGRARFVTVARSRQAEALKFLIANAFTTPPFMIRPDILRKIQPTGIIDRVRTAHAGIMGQLLQAQRLDRMAEQIALDGDKVAYPPLQFLMDLRAGVWSELATPATAIDIYRRNLQRAYLDNMDGRLNGSNGSSEVRALVRGELLALDRQLQPAMPGATDELTRRHLQDCRDQIAESLDRLVPRPAAPAGGAFGRGRGGAR